MRDVVSRLIFGVVMALLVPGAIVVVAVTFFFVASTGYVTNAVGPITQGVYYIWFFSTVRVLVFLVLSLGTGMILHSLHWAVVGFLERVPNTKQANPPTPFPVTQSTWHQRFIGGQILLAPVMAVFEILKFLFLGFVDRSLHDVVREDVVSPDPNRLQILQVLEDRYLRFAQVFINTSYALIFTCIGFFIFSLNNSWTERRLWITLSLYLIAGLLFVLGRLSVASFTRAADGLIGAKIRPQAVTPRRARPQTRKKARKKTRRR